MANKVLSAVKRLEREGDAYSVHSQKLVAAANLLADAIVNALPDDVVSLPGSYCVWRRGPGPVRFMMVGGGTKHIFNDHPMAAADVKFARIFAQDVANGFLYGIHDMLFCQPENRSAAEEFSKTFSLAFPIR